MEEESLHSATELAKELYFYAINGPELSSLVDQTIQAIKERCILPEVVTKLATTTIDLYRSTNRIPDFQVSAFAKSILIGKLVKYMQDQLGWTEEIPTKPGLYAAAVPDQDGWDVHCINVEGLPGDSLRYALLDGGVAYPDNPNSTLHDAYWYEIILPPFPNPLSSGDEYAD